MIFQRVSRTIRKKIETFEESGMGYWEKKVLGER